MGGSYGSSRYRLFSGRSWSQPSSCFLDGRRRCMPSRISAVGGLMLDHGPTAAAGTPHALVPRCGIRLCRDPPRPAARFCAVRHSKKSGAPRRPGFGRITSSSPRSSSDGTLPKPEAVDTFLDRSRSLASGGFPASMAAGLITCAPPFEWPHRNFFQAGRPFPCRVAKIRSYSIEPPPPATFLRGSSG